MFVSRWIPKDRWPSRVKLAHTAALRALRLINNPIECQHLCHARIIECKLLRGLWSGDVVFQLIVSIPPELIDIPGESLDYAVVTIRCRLMRAVAEIVTVELPGTSYHWTFRAADLVDGQPSPTTSAS